MEMAINKSGEDLYSLSEDRMFLLVVNSLLGFIHDDDTSPWQARTQLILEMLMPETIDGKEDFHRLLFILIVTQVVGLREIEPEALQKIRGCINEEEFRPVHKIDLAHKNNVEFIIEHVSKYGIDAGCSNARIAFSEIEALSDKCQMYEVCKHEY